MSKPVCSSCGGDNVRVDAWAEWDEAQEVWTIHSTYPENSYCEDCASECTLEWE